jgi:arylsulfatase A-like enzyme
MRTLAGIVSCLSVVVSAQAQPAPPNVVLIVSDDAGYADFSMHGSTEIPTPRIDSIATNGVRFAQGYVTASVCSPSRAGLLTGRYQQRFGYERNIPPRYSETNGLPLDETTLADMLRPAGYRTIALGKWHLGYADHFHPLSRGFDDYFGFLQGARSFWSIEGTRLNRLLRDREPIPESFDYMTDELGRQAAAYIREHATRPFFVYLAFNAVHTPMHARDDDLAAFPDIEKPRRRKLAAMTRALDRAVGTVLDALDETGVAENTIVVFINDNGGATNNASINTPLRGKKGSPFEGGIRVPFAVRWPARLPAGVVYELPVSALDVVTTVRAAAGLTDEPPRPLDGVDLAPYLTGDREGRPHQWLHWRRRNNMAVRDDDWRLVRHKGGDPLLFDLARDPGERNDLAAKEPQRVGDMLARQQAWTASFAGARPNILWIIGEDLGPELSCYGTPQVWTPRLDALAREGVRYTHAFTTSPVCSASRSAFMTGMYQTSIGAHHHRSHRDDGYRLPDDVRLLTDRLREAGYYTANVRHLSDEPGTKFFRGTGKTDWNFSYDGKPFDTDRWSDLKSHEPFYAQVNFSETHRGRAWNNAHKHIDRTANPDEVVVPPYYPDHPVTREDWAQYLNTVMALDRKVGDVLDRLEQDGLADRTIVMFFGDHGRAMIRGKQWCYDSGLRIPLIVRWPEGLAMPPGWNPGRVSNRLVSAIDLTASTLALAGVSRPASMQGRVFVGGEADPPRSYVFAARDRCDETVFRIRTVRDSRFRYIRNFMAERPFLQTNRYKERSYPVLALMRELHEQGELEPLPAVLFAPSRPAEELYDLDADPYETVNLATSPTHREDLERLRRRLETWIVDTNDHGRTPEPAAKD